MAANEEQAVSVIEAPGADGERAPVLPAPATEHRGTAVSDRLLALRRFHRGDPGSAADLSAPGDDLVPALLHRYRDPRRLRCDYPVLLAPPGDADETRACTTITAVLADTDPDGRGRLEECLRDAASRCEGRVDARRALREAEKALADDLAPEPVPAALLATIQGLGDALPEGGSLLSLDEHTPLHLFIFAAERRARARYDALREEVTRLNRVMRDLMRAERAKLTDGSRTDVLEETVGSGATAHIDVEALANVLGAPRGVESLDPGRRQRIEKVTEVFQRFLAEEPPPPLRVVAAGPRPEALAADGVTWHPAGAGCACRCAMDLFDEQATVYAELFAAVRVARLLAAGAYDPERHDALQEAFNRDAFSADELRGLPPILVLGSSDDLSGEGMIDLLHMLRSGRPLHVIVTVEPSTDPGRPRDDDPLAGYRFELAYLGISHREAFVHQSSAARPVHLFQGFVDGLDSTRTSLHVLTSGLTAEGVAPALGAWAHTGAALEGRAHPFVHYDPEAGETWARRIDIEGNPQPDQDWPVYELSCRTADGSPESLPLAFTFADFALLEHRYCDHFRIVPPECDHDDLVMLSAYLSMTADGDAAEMDHRLPFIWGADAEGQLRRLLVTRRLAFACRDRLDYWRTLQELAGVRNEYVREAVEREREQLESNFAEERERQAAEYAASLDAAREDAARDAMQRLAYALLAADPAAALATIKGATDTAPASAPATVPGTFAQLVQAAEKCPAKCIHPGTPLDPDEPNLPDLIERAKPFNV